MFFLGAMPSIDKGLNAIKINQSAFSAPKIIKKKKSSHCIESYNCPDFFGDNNPTGKTVSLGQEQCQVISATQVSISEYTRMNRHHPIP